MHTRTFYKSDNADVGSSPSLMLWDLLEAAKAQISYHDSFHPTFRGINSVDFSTSQFDLAIVATRHSDLNTCELISSSKLVLDCTATIAGVFWL